MKQQLLLFVVLVLMGIGAINGEGPIVPDPTSTTGAASSTAAAEKAALLKQFYGSLNDVQKHQFLLLFGDMFTTADLEGTSSSTSTAVTPVLAEVETQVQVRGGIVILGCVYWFFYPQDFIACLVTKVAEMFNAIGCTFPGNLLDPNLLVNFVQCVINKLGEAARLAIEKMDVSLQQSFKPLGCPLTILVPVEFIGCITKASGQAISTALAPFAMFSGNIMPQWQKLVVCVTGHNVMDKVSTDINAFVANPLEFVKVKVSTALSTMNTVASDILKAFLGDGVNDGLLTAMGKNAETLGGLQAFMTMAGGVFDVFWSGLITLSKTDPVLACLVDSVPPVFRTNPFAAAMHFRETVASAGLNASAPSVQASPAMLEAAAELMHTTSTELKLRLDFTDLITKAIGAMWNAIVKLINAAGPTLENIVGLIVDKLMSLIVGGDKQILRDKVNSYVFNSDNLKAATTSMEQVKQGMMANNINTVNTGVEGLNKLQTEKFKVSWPLFVDIGIDYVKDKLGKWVNSDQAPFGASSFSNNIVNLFDSTNGDDMFTNFANTFLSHLKLAKAPTAAEIKASTADATASRAAIKSEGIIPGFGWICDQVINVIDGCSGVIEQTIDAVMGLIPCVGDILSGIVIAIVQLLWFILAKGLLKWVLEAIMSFVINFSVEALRKPILNQVQTLQNEIYSDAPVSWGAFRGIARKISTVLLNVWQYVLEGQLKSEIQLMHEYRELSNQFVQVGRLVQATMQKQTLVVAGTQQTCQIVTPPDMGQATMWMTMPSTSTYNAAKTMCAQNNNMRICNYAEMCGDAFNTPLFTKFGGDQWAPMNDHANGWIQVGGGGEWPICWNHIQAAGADPAWSTDSSPLGFRGHLCCIKPPTLVWKTGTPSMTYDAAVSMCAADNNMALCTHAQMCGPDPFVSPAFTPVSTDSWVPIRAENGVGNDWIQIGYHTAVKLCETHTHAGFGYPEWGQSTDIRTFRGTVCCTPQSMTNPMTAFVEEKATYMVTNLHTASRTATSTVRDRVRAPKAAARLKREGYGVGDLNPHKRV